MSADKEFEKYDLPPALLNEMPEEFDWQAVMPMEAILPYIDRIALGQRDAEGSEWLDSQNKVIKPALKKFIWSKALRGSLPKISNGEGHQIHFLRAWNKVCDRIIGIDLGGDETREKYLDTVVSGISDFMSGILLPISLMGYDKENSHTRESAYEAIIRTLEAGKFETEGFDCLVDGHSYQFISEAWNPTGTGREFSKEGRLLRRFEMQCLSFDEINRVEHLEVDFESGELLIGDWIRCKAFTEWYRSLGVSYNRSGSDAGAVENTTEMLKEIGLVQVHTANTTVDVYEEDGSLIIAHADYSVSEESFDAAPLSKRSPSLAHVSCDRWTICIIDKEHLRSHLETLLGSSEDAEVSLQDFLEGKDAPSRVTVKPGKYHLYFGRNHIANKNLSEFSFEGLSTDNLHTYCILSDRERKHHHKDDLPLSAPAP